MLPHAAHTLDTIWGHQVLKDLLCRLVQENRLPHAALLHGPDAVGKRSLAFALAKLIFSQDVEPEVSLLAPPTLEMRWRFGRAFHAEDDLFGGMDDLFGDLAPEPDPEPEPPLPVPQPPKKDEPAKAKSREKSAKAAPAAAEAPPAPSPAPDPAAPMPPVALPPKGELATASAPPSADPVQRVLRPVDPRVDRLVGRSYPLEYDSDDVPVPKGHIDLVVIEPLGARSPSRWSRPGFSRTSPWCPRWRRATGW